MSGCDSEWPIVLMIYFACWKRGGGGGGGGAICGILIKLVFLSRAFVFIQVDSL